MTDNRIRAALIVRPLFFLIALFFLSESLCSAQRQVSASVESKVLAKGKKTISKKDVFCKSDGSLVVHSYYDDADMYFLVSRLGVVKLYSPATNEVLNDVQGIMEAKDELLYIFANGMGEDLGISQYEFVISDSKKEDGYLKRTFISKISSNKCAKVEVVYKDYLPICAIYYDKKGRVLTKTYLSNYEATGNFIFPRRVTEITYFMEKGDSTVRLDLYSNIKVNEPAPEFDFVVPADAKPIDIKEIQKAFKNSKK